MSADGGRGSVTIIQNKAPRKTAAPLGNPSPSLLLRRNKQAISGICLDNLFSYPDSKQSPTSRPSSRLKKKETVDLHSVSFFGCLFALGVPARPDQISFFSGLAIFVAAAALVRSYFVIASPVHIVPKALSQKVKKGCEKLDLMPQLWWWMSW